MAAHAACRLVARTPNAPPTALAKTGIIQTLAKRDLGQWIHPALIHMVDTQAHQPEMKVWQPLVVIAFEFA